MTFKQLYYRKSKTITIIINLEESVLNTIKILKKYYRLKFVNICIFNINFFSYYPLTFLLCKFKIKEKKIEDMDKFVFVF